jgi:hypothetical protein
LWLLNISVKGEYTMAKGSSTSANKKSNTVFKRTSQGGSRPKTSAMNKDQKKAFKHYRGQGK